ncbi:MAG: helix-turn-helix transcriptional regulator [Eubacteriales bacterium]|nr:helix-turn-helix transcriptional regulator [Eubacteriales bacterium]
MDIKLLVGKRVRELRNSIGISQEELAVLAGLDRTYITSVECGKRNISIVNIEKLANALQVSLKEFFSF